MPYSRQHIIAKPRPYQSVLTCVLIALAAVFTDRYFFHSPSDITSQQALITQQQRVITQLQQRNEQLTAEKEHLLVLEDVASKAQSELALEQATTRALQQQIQQLQQKVLAQGKEIRFYRTITDGHASTKLQFRELDLRLHASDPDRISFRLIVSQGAKITRPITGDVFLTLNFPSGEQHIPQQFGPYPLKLRLVQIIEGQIAVPERQTPRSVTVTLKQKGKVTLSKTFDWQPKLR